MSSYVKLFSSILDSTVWLTPPHVRLVWITMLAMADRDGIVWASVPGLANRAGVSRAECDEALEMFLSPDPDSRTPDEEGRRIRKIDGGWELINHSKHRDRMNAEDRKERDAARKAKKREEEAAKKSADSPHLSEVVRTSPHASEVVRADADSPQQSASVRTSPRPSRNVRDVSHADADAEADPLSQRAGAWPPSAHTVAGWVFSWWKSEHPSTAIFGLNDIRQTLDGRGIQSTNMRKCATKVVEITGWLAQYPDPETGKAHLRAMLAAWEADPWVSGEKAHEVATIDPDKYLRAAVAAGWRHEPSEAA